MTTRRLWIWLLILATAAPPAWPGRAVAASPVPLAVGEIMIPEDLLSRQVPFRTAFANAFGRKDRVSVVPRAEIERFRKDNVAASGQAAGKEALQEARELLGRGKKAYEALDFRRSAPLLEEARRQFILHLNDLRTNRELIDAHLFLGLSLAALNQMDPAKQEFRRVVYLDPRRELSSKNHPPKVVSLFTKIRQEVLSAEPVRLRIESTPAEASVYLNGRPSGTTPVEMQLQPGEYFVLVEKAGTLPWYQPVTLKKRVENVRATLKPSDQDLAWLSLFRVREGAPEQRAEDVGDLQALARSAGAQVVFLGMLQKERGYRLLGQLYDARTSDFSKVVMLELGNDLSDFSNSAMDVADALMPFLRPDGYVEPGQKADLGLPSTELTVGAADRPKEEMLNAPPPEKAWYENWWVWPLIAAAGAGIVYGSIALAGSSQSGKIVIHNKGNY